MSKHSLKLLVAVAFVVGGLMLLLRAAAASPALAVEPETGIFSTSVSATSDTSASHGQAIIFGQRIVSVKDFGALCDGSHDDLAALQAAVSSIKAAGGVITIPSADCRLLMTASHPFTDLPANVTLRGSGSASKLSMACDVPDSYRNLLRVNGDNVHLDNLTLVRATNCSGVMLPIRPSSGFTMTDVTLDGQAPLLTGSLSAVEIANVKGGIYRNITLKNSKIQNFGYGVLQSNLAQTNLDGFMVDGCRFTANGADDLEFNAPSAVMTHVTIQNSSFKDNRAANVGYGFGVGMANVQDGLIANNTFDHYFNEPVHIEDRSQRIIVRDNSFTNSFLHAASYASQVFIVSDSHFITVQHNVFDTAGNSSAVYGIFIGAGGSRFKIPSDITVEDNTFKLRPGAKKIYASGVPRVVESGSSVIAIP